MIAKVCHLLRYLLFSALGATLGVLALTVPVSSADSSDTTGISSGKAHAYMESGTASFRRGHFQRALQDWDRAIGVFEQTGDLRGQANALLRKGAAYLSLGKHPNAAESLTQGLAIALKTGDTRLAANITSTLGQTYLLLGHTGEARRALESSMNLAREAGDDEVLAKASNNLGNLFATLGQFDQAIRTYNESLENAEKSGNASLVTKVSVNLARTLLDSGDNADNRAFLDKALQRARALEPSHDKAYALISLGSLYARSEAQNTQGEHSLQAAQAFRDAAETAEAIGDQRALSYAYGNLGKLYERAERFAEALQLTHQATRAAQRIRAPESLYRWQWQTGRILKAQGKTESAIGAYQRAVYTLRDIRHALLPGYQTGQRSFREQLGPVYLELADLLLQRSANHTDPEQIEINLREVRETVELLKGAELEDYFQDDCVTALKAKTRGIDQLGSRTAAVYPIILPDRLELLLSLPNGMQRFSTAVDADTFVREVRILRRRLEKRTTHQYLPHAQQVYDWMIRPLESELKGNHIDTLVFVPDGALRTIPMAALHDGENFLISRYAIATTPGLTLTDPRPIARQKTQLLLTGLSEPVQGFAALPNVEAELASIEERYGGTRLQDKDFLVSRVETELKNTPFSIVHVASHGQFSSDLSKTFLLTYDGKLSMDTLEQYMGMTRYRDDPVELLTLSACQTAAGDDRAALGLAGVAVKAGARSAIATLWYVNDRASALLVPEFYRQLQDPSLTKAEALQAAQRALITDYRYRHPGYWSPYLLIGNWL